jgi:hypothetical protein
VIELGSLEKLRADHDVASFNCGKEALNRFVMRHAWVSQQANSARTYVLSRELSVLGYFAAAGERLAAARDGLNSSLRPTQYILEIP